MGAQITIGTNLLNGRRVGYITGQKTLGTDETVKEALDYGYVVGQKESIIAMANGLMKAMVDGVAKDGDGRKVDEYLSFNPFANGKLDDITDDLDLAKVGVSVQARALKRLQPDCSDWTFIVEGSVGGLSVSTVTTGEKLGEIVLGEAVDINGWGLSGDEVAISWEVPDLSLRGTVAAEKITAEYTRITVDGDALQELVPAGANGKTIVFTIRVGNRKAVKSALVIAA